MDVSTAKKHSSWKTLTEMADHLYNELGISMKDRLSKEEHGLLGYLPAVASHLKSILKKRVMLNSLELGGEGKTIQPVNTDNLAPQISSFEWLANIYEMFNAILMNTDLLIKKDNIDR